MRLKSTKGDATGPYITVPEAAEFLRLSEISIRRYLTKKTLKRYKVGARTLLRREEVEAMIKAQ